MISESNVDHAKDPPPQTPETQIECVHCHAKVPATVALGFEGADYLYHFCGPACFEAWRKTPAPPD